MTCEELKNKIINKTVDDSLLICVYKDNTFVINQYIKQISLDKKLTIVYIESLEEIYVDSNSFFGANTDVLYVWHIDALDCTEDILRYNNLIVVCKKVNNGNICQNNIVEFDKLTKEQILEYLQVSCPEITVNNLEWLYDVAGGDIFRLDREIQKLKIFYGNQQEMFNLIRSEQGYSDLNQATIYNCVNAIIDKNKDMLLTILQNLDIIDVEGTGLVTLLLRDVRHLLDIKTIRGANAANTKMSEKQFSVLSRKCKNFSLPQLIDMYEFLTGIDYQLKSGQLELSNDKFVGYILTNIMEIGYEIQ